MKRFLKVTLIVAIAALISAPAFAEYSATGFFRAKGEVQTWNFGAGATSGLVKDAHSHPFVEQRIRIKNTFSNNEFAKAVFYIESDQTWGLGCSGSNANVCRNGGGNIGADRVNIELKNLYVWFKIPDSNHSFKVGIQGIKDPYKFILFLQDVSALVFNTKLNDVGLRLAWIKGMEGNRNFADDYDLYLADANFKAADNLNLGLHVYYFNDDSNRAGGSTDDIYTAGITGKTKLGDVSLDAFFLYQFGTMDVPAGTDMDHAAFAGNLGAKAKLGPGSAFFEAIYISGDDDATDTDISNLTPMKGTNTPFYIAPHMYIITYNAEQHTNAASLFALDTNGNKGRGLITVAAGYKQKLTDSVTGQFGVGYASDAEKGTSGTAWADEERSAFEVNARVDTSITKGLTVGLVGAYATLDSFNLSATTDADDQFLAYIPLTYKF